MTDFPESQDLLKIGARDYCTPPGVTTQPGFGLSPTRCTHPFALGTPLVYMYKYISLYIYLYLNIL